MSPSSLLPDSADFTDGPALPLGQEGPNHSQGPDVALREQTLSGPQLDS